MRHWYYQVELEAGVFSSGALRPSLALVRAFLERATLTGARCLDIGTQEAAVPVLLRRQGAEFVVAYDRLSLADRVDAIKKSYGVEFQYVHGVSLRELKAALPAASIDPIFDFVNFSGILYHLVDPFVGLAVARSLLREGGLLFIETSVSMTDAPTIEFNTAGRLYGGTNYFQISVGVLDYWLRMLRLAPIDCAQIGRGAVARVLIVCRAMSGPEVEPGDAWMRKDFAAVEFAEYGLDYTTLEGGKPTLTYNRWADGVPRKGTKSIRVWETLQSLTPYRIDPDRQTLRLADSI